MDPLKRPALTLQIPVAMIEQKIEALKTRLGANDDTLVAKLAASLAIRKVSIPDAHCRVGRTYRVAAPRPAKRRSAARRPRSRPGPVAVAAVATAAAQLAPPRLPVPVPINARRGAIVDANTEAGLGARLSPSQVRTWFDCQARWYFGRVVGLPDPPNGNLALGIAIHDALAHNFGQKIESGKDLPVAEVLDAFDLAWRAVLQEATLRDDENHEDMALTGRALIEKFMREEAPHIHPADVELEVDGAIAGVKVTGRIDVLDRDGMIHDFKSRAKSPSDGMEPADVFAVATYAALAPAASGLVRIHSLVKTKAPKIVQQTRTIDEQDREAIDKQYPLAQEGMRAGLYMPNRQSMLCSQRNCAFWRECQTEFGGKVPLT